MENDFKVLKDFLRGSYYQTVWDDYSGNSEILNDYFKRNGRMKIELLLNNIIEFEKVDDEKFLLQFFYYYCDGIGFDSKDEIFTFLEEIKKNITEILKMK